MKIPSIPFDLLVEHNGAEIAAQCLDAKPVRNSDSTWKFVFETRRVFGMLPDEQIWLRGKGEIRCRATMLQCLCGMNGSNTIEIMATVPDGFFVTQAAN
jgi:hypothetical protein